MSKKIKYTITVNVPGNICNLRCEYCYISQVIDENHQVSACFKYNVQDMISAFHPERLGGVASIVVIGAGETLIPKEVVPFVKGLLELGHYVEVVTNLTLENRIDELLDTSKENLSRLCVKGSLHWLELKRLGLLDIYFRNMKKVIDAGASTYPFFVACQEYEPYLEEIRDIFVEKFGEKGLPQCSPCLLFDDKRDFFKYGKLRTTPECDEEFVKKMQELFHSEIFATCVRFLSVNPSEIFCYAGKWSFTVDMGTGMMGYCHNCISNNNFFQNQDEMPELDAIACSCGISNCALQYNFVGQGLIPEIDGVPTYGQMLADTSTIRAEYKEAMDFKYYWDNTLYNKQEERRIVNSRAEAKERQLYLEIGRLQNLVKEYETNYSKVQEYITVIKGELEGKRE